MKCPSLEQIYDMDLDNLLTLKSNIEQNKINFNEMPLDEDDYDLYDYNSPNNKESIIELINSEIKERESTKDLLNFFTNLNYDNNINTIESKFLQELNSNKNIYNKPIEENILNKNKNIDEAKKLFINGYLSNKNIFDKNKNNINQPIKITPNEGIKSLLSRTKIDPTHLQYTVSSNKYVDKFWSIDKERKNRKKNQNNNNKHSEIYNSNTNNNIKSTTNISNCSHASSNKNNYIKSDRKNGLFSEKIIIGAIPIGQNKTKKVKKKRKKEKNKEKINTLELMRNYKVSDITQFLKKKTSLKPLNISTAINKNNNINKNKQNSNEFIPNIKLYNKTQNNLEDNNENKNRDLNHKNNNYNNKNLQIQTNIIHNNRNSIKNNNIICIDHFYFYYENNNFKEIIYEIDKYKELTNKTNYFTKNNRVLNRVLKQSNFEIKQIEPIFLNIQKKSFSKIIINNDNQINPQEINIIQNKENINNKYESEKNDINDLRENIINKDSEMNLLNEKILSVKNIEKNSNLLENKKYNDEEKDINELDKKNYNNKKLTDHENEKNEIIINKNNINPQKIEGNKIEKDIEFKKNNIEYIKNDNIKENQNDYNDPIDSANHQISNNNKDEILKEEENEEYEDEEEEIDDNNKEYNSKKDEIIKELIFSKNQQNASNRINIRNINKKYTLNPIKPKNKNINNFNINCNFNQNKILNNNQKNKININNSNDKQNFSETFEKRILSPNQNETKKYVLSSLKPHNIVSQYNFSKNLMKFPNQRPKSSLSKNVLIENNNISLDNVIDYGEIFSNFSEIFSGYYLSNNYSQQGVFNLNNTMGELYESFNKLYYYEMNQALIRQKDEMYNDIVRAEAGVIVNRIKKAQEKLLKEEDINTNIDKYCILKRCIDLERKNYGRDLDDNNDNFDGQEKNNYKEKKFFRVVLSRPEIYDIVCYTLYKDNSWSELPHGLSLGQCWNLYWSYGPPGIDFSRLFSFQKVNHLINNRIVHRKDLLHKHIMRVRKLNKKCNEIFNIMPLTFLLSKEYVNFVEEFHRIKDTDDYNIWIVKPVGKSRGKGIFLIDNISDVPLNDTFLVQKYLTSPLLLDEGYKFDMRIYCLVTSVNPLEMFLYKDGFARVSNELYTLDITNMKVHLTNAAIQNRQAKKSNNYEKIYGGSKISLDMLRYKLRRQYGIDFDTIIWPQVKDIITKVFICCQNDIPYCPSTFEMFGFDVIIDSNFKCWLLEINSSPSLERSNVLDDEIKLPLVNDIIKIVDPIEIDKYALINVLERVMKIKNNPKNKNVYLYSPKIQLNIDLTNIFRGKMPRKYGEEPKNMGRFEMICPNKETDKLIRMAGGQKYYNNKKEKK